MWHVFFSFRFASAGLVFLFAGLSNPLWGQLQRILHQSFAVDSANQIELDLYGDFVTRTWSGNAVLAETQIKIYGATRGILDFAIDQGRYKIEADRQSGRVLLRSSDMVRPVISTPKGQSYEEIVTTIYIPDQFQLVDERRWARKTPLPFATSPADTLSSPADSLAKPEEY